MGLLEHLEKLINEHGSAAILREHLALVKAEHAALERQCADLQSQCDALAADSQQLRVRLGALTKLMSDAIQTSLACDHCGSPQLKRVGNRDDPTFGVLGIKQAVYRCLACGQETLETPKS